MFKKDSYWTLPLDYSEMRENSPTLYSELAKSDLLIFKGQSRYSACMDMCCWTQASAQHIEVQ